MQEKFQIHSICFDLNFIEKKSPFPVFLNFIFCFCFSFCFCKNIFYLLVYLTFCSLCACKQNRWMDCQLFLHLLLHVPVAMFFKVRSSCCVVMFLYKFQPTKRMCQYTLNMLYFIRVRKSNSPSLELYLLEKIKRNTYDSTFYSIFYFLIFILSE